MSSELGEPVWGDPSFHHDDRRHRGRLSRLRCTRSHRRKAAFFFFFFLRLGRRHCLKTIMRGEVMKIVVIGGTGLIGSKVVANLKRKGHEAIAAAPNTGVNTITGEGLKEAMAGAQVVIDLANSPSFEDKAVLEFFETSGRNLLAAETAAGVRHHVALSIVGIDRTDNGYFRAKVAQEKLIVASGIPYTIIRATQFMEFLGGIAASSADGNISQASARPVPADRGGRRCCHRRRGGARGAAKRHRRDRRPGTSAVQRNRRPLSEGGRRPARGRERPRGPILGRPGRGALAGAVGRSAPRPHRSRRMAPPLTGSSLIPHPPTEG